jgi:SAM-dependent methyltransferase
MSANDRVIEAARYWESHAKSDPLWAVLSDPTKRGRRWDLDTFFETGRREISLLMFQLEELGLSPSGECALDFGCGVGRLSQALATYFKRVIGLDVAPTMVRLAEQLNRFHDRVTYVLNQQLDLSIVPTRSVTFVYSDIVLQHLEPDLAAAYIRDFLRVAAWKGIIVFQLPSHRRATEEMPTPVTPLPLSAYRADITQRSPAKTATYPAATPIQLVVAIRNLGEHAWSTHVGGIRVGNHWRSADDDAMLIQDDGRTSIPALASGDSATVEIEVRTPARPGSYVCEIDLVHEGLWWFADQGSQTLRIPVRVSEVAADDANRTVRDSRAVSYGSAKLVYETLPDDSVAPGEFPMHGMAREAVERLVNAHGGVLRHVEVDERCGREWIGYRYYVQKVPPLRRLFRDLSWRLRGRNDHRLSQGVGSPRR